MNALQPGRFCEGLEIETLLDDTKFSTAREWVEENYSPDWYWDGNLAWCRSEEIKKERRRLEDRLRKDPQALLRAWKAVFQV